MRSTIHTIPPLLALTAAYAAGAPLELYVSPEGNDAWTGALAAPAAGDGPLATLSAARDRLREARAQGRLAEGAIVNVLSGTYYLAEPLALGAEDGGAPEAPIIWRGVGETKPVLVCGVSAPAPATAEGGLLRFDLAAAGTDPATVGGVRFRGVRMDLARYPNADPSDPHGGQWAYVASVEGDENQREFHYGEDEEHAWTNPIEGEVAIFSGYDWAFSVAPIESHDPAGRTIRLAKDAWCPIRIGDRYVVRGLREDLDAPGEWHLDRASGTLLFLPPDPEVREGDVVLGTVAHALRCEGASDIEFRGFRLEAATDAGVMLRGCTRTVAAACEIVDCDGWGAVVEGGARSGVRGCDISGSGHGGVSISGGDRDTLQGGGNFAENCVIHHCAAIWKTYRPGVSVHGVGSRISHNLIHDLPHAGITLAGNDNVVEYNVVHHVNLESADTGGLYFCSRDWTQRGNVIRYNLFHHLGGFGKVNSWAPLRDGKVAFSYPHFTWGIYLDDPTTGTEVFGNIVYDAPICALHNHGGRDNLWENNILVNSPALNAGMLAPDWSEWPSIFDRLRERRNEGSPYLERYPEIAGIADTRPEEMSGVRFVRNIVYNTVEGTAWLRGENGWGDTMPLYQLRMSPDDFAANEWSSNCIYYEPGVDLRVSVDLLSGGEQMTWEKWQATGADATSIAADPLFVDAANHDYRLRPDSPALALGFQPIPIDEIGPYESPDRASWPPAAGPSVESLGELRTERFYQPPQFRPVPASEFAVRGGIPNVIAEAMAGETIRVAYFGGGIHYADGWRALLPAWCAEQGVRAEFLDASVTDAVRGSGFSLYRLEHDVLRYDPDLILIDFASDDRDADAIDLERIVESFVRRTWRRDRSVDLLFVYAYRDGFESAYAEGNCPAAVSAYERVAEHYGIPTVNMGCHAVLASDPDRLVRPAGEQGGEDVYVSTDGRRPTARGNALYAECLRSALDALAAGPSEAAPHALPAPRDPRNYENANQVPIAPSMLEGEWTALGQDSPLVRDSARHMDGLWTTRQPGATLTFRFRGTAASVLCLMGPATGKVRVTVDGQDRGVRTMVDRWCTYYRLAALDVAGGLEDAEHTVVLELLADAPDRTEPINAAREQGAFQAADFEGVAAHFASIRVIGEVLE